MLYDIFEPFPGLSAQVSAETDPVAILPKVVALLYIQFYARDLQAPGRTISVAITKLKVYWTLAISKRKTRGPTMMHALRVLKLKKINCLKCEKTLKRTMKGKRRS